MWYFRALTGPTAGSRRSRAGRAQPRDADVVIQLDRKRRVREIASIYLLHPLHEPPIDFRIRRDKALGGLRIGCLDVNDGEGAAIRRLLMPDGLARDSGVFPRGRIFIPASALDLVPGLAIKILLPTHDGQDEHDLGHSAFLP